MEPMTLSLRIDEDRTGKEPRYYVELVLNGHDYSFGKFFAREAADLLIQRIQASFAADFKDYEQQRIAAGE